MWDDTSPNVVAGEGTRQHGGTVPGESQLAEPAALWSC